MTEVTIHSTAVVDPSAELGLDVTIGPYAVVEADTRIGDGCRLDAHSVVRQYTTLGRECHLHPMAVIGDLAQDLSFKGAKSYVEIGDKCVFREGTTVHRGTKADTVTKLGNHVYMMVQSHVGHNCTVHDHVILVNGAALGGYVEVQKGAFLSGFVGIHQFCRVGSLCLIAANTKIDRDLPPFTLVDGFPRAIKRINRIGMQRAGIDDESIALVEQSYLQIAKSSDPLEAGKSLGDSEHAILRQIGEFYRTSDRGVMRRFAL